MSITSLALGILLSSVLPAHSCYALDEQVISQHVRSVVSAQSHDESADQVSRLVAYWGRACSASRASASRQTVEDIASLLRYPRFRLSIAAMLRRITENRRYAERALRYALADQVVIESSLARSAYPAVPSTHNVISQSLICALQHVMGEVGENGECFYLDLYESNP